MVGVEWPQAFEWQRANFFKRRRTDADAVRKGSVPLLSVTTRPKQYAAGAGASGAALAGLIAMAIALGEIFGFHGLHIGASSSQGPALELPAGLRAAGATPGGVPLPVLRIAAAARGAAAATAPARRAPRLATHTPAARGPRSPLTPVSSVPGGSEPSGGTTPAAGSGSGSSGTPAPPSGGSSGGGPISSVAQPVSKAVSDTTASAGSALQPVSPSAGNTVTSAGQTGAQTVTAVAQTVDQVVQSVTTPVQQTTTQVSGAVSGATGGAVKLP